MSRWAPVPCEACYTSDSKGVHHTWTCPRCKAKNDDVTKNFLQGSQHYSTCDKCVLTIKLAHVTQPPMTNIRKPRVEVIE